MQTVTTFWKSKLTICINSLILVQSLVSSSLETGPGTMEITISVNKILPVMLLITVLFLKETNIQNSASTCLHLTLSGSISSVQFSSVVQSFLAVCNPMDCRTKIMASGPITSWQIDGEIVETMTDFIFGRLQNRFRRWLQTRN